MRNQSTWKLFVLWALGPAVIGALSLSVPFTIISGMPAVSFMGDNAVAPLLLFAFALVVITAPLIGVAQGLILKYWINKAEPLLVGKWVVATLAGVLLAIVAVVIVNVSLLCGGGIVLPGAVLGFAQWLVLKSYVQKAGWWIVACAVAWNASMLVGWAVGTALLPTSILSALPYLPFERLLGLETVAFAGMLTFGLMTGLGLIGLLTRRDLSRLESKS